MRIGIDCDGVLRDFIPHLIKNIKENHPEHADKIGVPRNKMPNNIVENFGNSNSVTIPVNLTHNLGSRLKDQRSLRLLLAGFGVGLTWGGLVLDVSGLNTCDLIEYDNKEC